MKSRIFQDQCDADTAAHEWLKSIAPKDRPHEIERFDIRLFQGHAVDGLLGCLWVGGILAGQTTVVRNDGNWSVLTCIDLRSNLRLKKPDAERPVKAFCCQVNGFDDCYIPAKTHSKARWRIVSGLRDIGYKESGNFHMVRVIRAPQYDEWAKTAKPVPISFEGLKEELKNSIWRME